MLNDSELISQIGFGIASFFLVNFMWEYVLPKTRAANQDFLFLLKRKTIGRIYYLKVFILYLLCYMFYVLVSRLIFHSSNFNDTFCYRTRDFVVKYI